MNASIGMMKINLKFHIPLFLFLLLFSLGGFSQSIAGGDNIGRKIRALKEENSLLEAELALASKRTSYIILDMRAESDSAPLRISLKNRGVVLREFAIERMRYRRTKGLAIEPFPLTKKTAFFGPKRKEIKPHKPEDGADAISDLDFLELKDIPSSYTLSFGRGLSLSVRGQPKGIIPRLLHLIGSAFIHFYNSLAIVWNHLWNNEFATLEITMGKEDAQALYWSFDEGMSIVVIESHQHETL